MNITIDEDQVYAILATTILRDYKHLRDNVDYEGDKAKLLDAFLTVIEYVTTGNQRKEAGL